MKFYSIVAIFLCSSLHLSAANPLSFSDVGNFFSNSVNDVTNSVENLNLPNIVPDSIKDISVPSIDLVKDAVSEYLPNSTDSFSIPGIEKLDIEGLVDQAMKSELLPTSAKGALVAGKALTQGLRELIASGDAKAMLDVVLNSTLEGGKELAISSPEIQLALVAISFAQDIRNGKNLGNSLSERTIEAINKLPASEVAKLAYDILMEIKNGKPASDVISDKRVHDALKSYVLEMLGMKKVAKLAESKEFDDMVLSKL